MKKKHLFYLSIAGSMALFSCGGGGEEKPVEADTPATDGIVVTDAEMEQAKALYFDRCAGCYLKHQKEIQLLAQKY